MEWNLFDGSIAPHSSLRERLNTLKNEITTLKSRGRGDHFRAAAAWVNPGEQLQPPSGLRLLSRAYHKLWEILYWHPLPGSDFYHAVLLCEAPGAFQQAVAHWMKVYHPASTFKWHGVTLPDGLEWKASASEVIYADVIKDELPPMCYHAHLVTGDGGFEVEEKNLNDQEAANHTLFAAQMQKGLACLLPGGMLVVKFFDMWNAETRQVIQETSAWFHHAFIFKPWGSRICNSERYFVGTLKRRVPVFGEVTTERLQTVAEQFAQVQIQALELALRMANETTRTPEQLREALAQSSVHCQLAQKISAHWTVS